ncbi:ATP-dependent helicase [Aestuariirhabdus sp. Z084]|uniref:UvrD-helicase domain-containing protein n=1 Tax=Aestuariirhabdus haliotis TaxID=2918751 RepID=UPI00201B41A9|nr:ATP-dependent helicase [Aestuariirhabdus haliotis]MCL6414814.1 ATP-dependent helicase [Aestuariirhabdus haliotis]MCL6418746.1 ATP-dependent helicase [Aestuariirhabdus haliotis]
MSDLSDEQQDIVQAPLCSMSVVACAGSGKTKTAVKRLIKIRGDLSRARSHIALLSFSNIAVDTFRTAFSTALSVQNGVIDSRVTIDTFDGFITSHILRPHAYRTMCCKQTPFLLSGNESFLKNKKYTYWYDLPNGETRSVQPNKLDDVVVSIESDRFVFYYRLHQNLYPIDNGFKVTKQLGRLGAYTHELGKLWSLSTLLNQPEILRVMVNRYPHILVDEAQDLGVLHQKILEVLIKNGACVSLIGDPNQAIFEFAGATGQYIRSFDEDEANDSQALTVNFRSVSGIVNVANALSGREDKSLKKTTNPLHGAYFTAYNPKNHSSIVDAFSSKLLELDLQTENSAVLYRSNIGIEKLRGKPKNFGQGRILQLASATFERDVNANYHKAFTLVTRCVVSLMLNAPNNIMTMLANPEYFPEVKPIRQDIWKFIRSKEEGLPSGHLKAKSEWHNLVKDRLINLLSNISVQHGITIADKLGNKLAKTNLIDAPIAPPPDFIVERQPSIRVDTVHQAKGESLDAVLYMATEKKHVESLLEGVETELGRIGYVALTRARNFFVLGIPDAHINDLSPMLEEVGIKKLVFEGNGFQFPKVASQEKLCIPITHKTQIKDGHVIWPFHYDFDQNKVDCPRCIELINNENISK